MFRRNPATQTTISRLDRYAVRYQLVETAAFIIVAGGLFAMLATIYYDPYYSFWGPPEQEQLDRQFVWVGVRLGVGAAALSLAALLF